MFPISVFTVLLAFPVCFFRLCTEVSRMFAVFFFLDVRDEYDGDSGKVQALFVLFFFCSISSIWTWKILRTNFSTGRTKCGEFWTRWLKASMNDYDRVQRFRLCSNMSFKEPLVSISVSTPYKKQYDAFSSPVCVSSNPLKKAFDRAFSAAFCIDWPACSAIMRLAF